jgi:DNA-binding CsgD family transcriptional regulator/tetratricopeptide (TPR) repeat protein
VAVAWPLVGRDEELAFLRRSLESKEAGGVVVAGPPGVGKTRLAREAATGLAGVVVEWTGATPASASIPFGAFAHLLPDFDEGSTFDRLRLLRAVETSLLRRADGRPLVLAVDDAQWLDPGACALIHGLVQRAVGHVLLTLRVGERTADPLVALWKDGLIERLELQPLTRPDVEALLAAVLDGPIEPATRRRFWQLCQGNALYLREVVLDAQERAALRQLDGVWTCTSRFQPSTRLVSILEERLGRVSPAGRTVLDHLAVGEPLPLDIIEMLCGAEGLAETEAAALTVVDGEDHASVHLSHPLHAEVLRSEMSTMSRRDVMERLADAFEHTRATSRAELLRVASWRLESRSAADAGLFKDAAQIANAMFDYALAERLARRAIELGGGASAALALGDALNHQGRGGEAQEVLTPLSDLEMSDEVRAEVAVARYFGLTVQGGFRSEFESVLLEAERRVAAPELRAFLRAQRATLLAFAGRLDDGIALAAPTDDAEVDEISRLRGVSALGGAWICAGKPESAAALAGEMFDPAVRHRDDLPQSLLWVVTIRLSALVTAGRLDEADDFIEFMDAATAAVGASVESFTFLAFARGLVALQRGRARTARRTLRESVASMRQTAIWQHLPFPLAHLVEACALAGDADGAVAAVREADDLVESVAIYEGIVRRARGWAALAQGQRSSAVERVLEAAEWAEAHGQRYAQLRALHDAIRFGEERHAPEAVVALGAGVEGPLARGLQAHAAAMVSGDGARLDGAATELEQTGAFLLAAEAAAHASAAYERVGLLGRRDRSLARARTLAATCEGARTPVLDDLDAPLPLTTREREVVRLAATGLSARAIAERLFISTRTAEGHLHRAYSKLGVSDRHGLNRVLRTGDADDARQ